ncbi:MAG: 2OG-Fe dioxygenase family protein [Nanoarchaeota archaeon]|nr:2OG-Fe dioxygenase family protein [Nanoarchaeota archaeon]
MDKKNEISERRFSFNEGSEILNNIKDEDSFKSLTKTWNSLLIDKYTREEDGLRYRRFAQMSKKTLNNKFLKNLVIFNFNNLLVSKTSSESWEVGIHMIRIVTKAGKKGKPAPEEVHKEGYDFISIQLIKKENMKGGIGEIFNKNKEIVMRKTLKNPLDSLYINNKKMFHYSPIFNPLNKEKDGTRDILIIDFNRG